MLVDSHTHLDFDAFDEDREVVIERAYEAGVKRMVAIGTDIDTSQAAVDLAATHPPLTAAAGVHPHHAGGWNKATAVELEALLESPEVVAVGEIGLDYHYPEPDPQQQQRAFVDQLRIARKHDRPVCVHDRDAHRDVLAILREQPLQRGGIIHCFSGDTAMARICHQLGFFLGIGGVVTFENAPELQQVVREVPLEWLVLETDCPFLSPHPYRGERNEPARVKEVAEKVASLKQLPVEKVAAVTTQNTDSLFRWNEAG